MSFCREEVVMTDGSDFRTPVESIGLQKPENLLLR
jgi:hypothetical protein